MTGNAYVVSIRTPEILDKLEKHPIWRSAPKRRRADSSREFSSVPASRVATKNYGTGGDACLGSVEIGTDGRDHHSLRRRRDGQRSSERRWPIGSRRIWAVSRTKSRSSRSTHSVRSIS